MKRASCKENKREESSSFLKKRTKKLLLSTVRTNVACRVNQHSKSFLVLFFKTELLSYSPLPECAGLFRIILSTRADPDHTASRVR
jgi:hypothetical protein